MRSVKLFVAFIVFLVFICLSSLFGQTTQPTRWDPATRPTLPIGAWYQPVANMDTWRARGINVLVGPELGNPARLTASQWAAEAASRGLWVIMDGKADPLIRPANLLAWLLPDEPDGHGVTAEQLAVQAKRFRTLDPDAPIIASFSGSALTSATGSRVATYQAYLRSCDIAWEDWYPVNQSLPTRTYPATHKSLALDMVQAWQIAIGKPPAAWSVVETSQFGARAPTPAEWEVQARHVLTRGKARGLIYFSHTYNANKVWSGYDGTAAEIAARMPILHRELTAAWNGLPATPTPQSQPADDAAALERRIRAIEDWMLKVRQ